MDSVKLSMPLADILVHSFSASVVNLTICLLGMISVLHMIRLAFRDNYHSPEKEQALYQDQGLVMCSPCSRKHDNVPQQQLCPYLL